MIRILFLSCNIIFLNRSFLIQRYAFRFYTTILLFLQHFLLLMIHDLFLSCNIVTLIAFTSIDTHFDFTFQHCFLDCSLLLMIHTSLYKDSHFTLTLRSYFPWVFFFCCYKHEGQTGVACVACRVQRHRSRPECVVPKAVSRPGL